MTQLWQPGEFYGQGSEVEYNGVRYKIQQPHTSQGDWTPDKTPALWGRMQGGGGGHHEGGHQGGQHGGQHGGGNWQGGNQGNQSGGNPYPQQGGNQPPVYGGGGQPHYGGGGPPQPNYNEKPPQQQHGQPPKEDESWFDENKKKLGLGAGIIAGGALLAGGIWAYSEHKDKEEEQAKAEEWRKNTSDNYFRQQAQDRCTELKRDNRGMQAYWILAEGGQIPQNAIPIGRESNGEPLYAARAFLKGGVHPGKIGRGFKRGGAAIAYGGKEHTVDFFEVLVGDPNKIRWVEQEGRVRLNGIGNPVEGGREEDGLFLFIALCEHKGGLHPGKINQNHEKACFGYGGDEETTKKYKIAVYA